MQSHIFTSAKDNMSFPSRYFRVVTDSIICLNLYHRCMFAPFLYIAELKLAILVILKITPCNF